MAGNSSAGQFLKGFMIGGMVGAAAAFLMAPRPGEETRTRIREKSVDLKEQTEATYADMQRKLEASIGALRTRFDELAAKVDEAVTQNRAALSKMAANMAEDIAPEKG